MPPKRDPPSDDDLRKHLKDHDLRACTWNVRFLFCEGTTAQLVDVLVRIKSGITSIQEVRWTGQGRKRVGPCDIYDSGHIREHKFGFMVRETLRRRVLAFTPGDERLATTPIKAKFFNISLIGAYAPTEEKDNLAKDAFYERLEYIFERCPRHDVKIVLGNFNDIVGKEGIFSITIRRFGLHDEKSLNGLSLIDFAAAALMSMLQALIKGILGSHRPSLSSELGRKISF